jgi:CBS domain-containing protein
MSTAATETSVPTFEGARVADVMTAGIVSCSAATALPTVARMMRQHRIHAVVVFAPYSAGERQPWAVVSDLDLMEAAAHGQLDDPAAAFAETPVVTVPPESPLSHAVELMAQRRTSHLLVVDSQSGHPLGVLSALDVAALLAARATWDETD